MTTGDKPGTSERSNKGISCGTERNGTTLSALQEVFLQPASPVGVPSPEGQVPRPTPPDTEPLSASDHANTLPQMEAAARQILAEAKADRIRTKAKADADVKLMHERAQDRPVHIRATMALVIVGIVALVVIALLAVGLYWAFTRGDTSLIINIGTFTIGALLGLITKNPFNQK